MHSRLDEVIPSDTPVTETAVVLEGDVEMKDVSGGSAEMQLFFQHVEKVKGTIQYVRDRTNDIIRLQDEALNAVRTEDQNRTSEELDSVLNDVSRRCTEAKQLLSVMKDRTDELAKGNANAPELRIRKNMYQTLTQNFVAAVRTYQQAQQNYKSKMKAKVARQVRIVKPEATYEEIDTAMKSGDPGAIYRAAILQPGCDPVAKAYVDVQAKYQDVLRLEESVKALNQMFRDMAFLVERQGEMLDQIEFSVNSAAEHVDDGKKHLQGALKARKSIRKKYLWLIGIAAVVIIVIVLATQL